MCGSAEEVKEVHYIQCVIIGAVFVSGVMNVVICLTK